MCLFRDNCFSLTKPREKFFCHETPVISPFIVEAPNTGYKILVTLKAPITTAADDIHKYFFLFFREDKT